MDAIEPFDYSAMVPFDISYLPGYLADKYDVSAEEDRNRVEVRMRNSALSAIKETAVGYSTLIPQSENLRLNPGKVHYAFLPVWLLTTRWNNQNYLFAINGQTGKMIGDLPTDNGKFILYLIGITVEIMLVLFLIFFVFMGM